MWLLFAELKASPPLSLWEAVIAMAHLFQRRNPTPLRYYVYISDGKLEMLFDQIDPGILKRISAEITVDLKVASIKLQEAESAGPSRNAKLRIVEQFIDKYHRVDDIEDIERDTAGRESNQNADFEYVRGRIPMQWGLMDSMVVFRGRVGSTTLVLGGSPHHLLGEKPPEISRLMSLAPAMVRAFLELETALKTSPPGLVEQSSQMDAGARALDFAAEAPFDGPTEHVEFLAVPMIWGGLTDRDGENYQAILGTPLYVARAR
ncbi:DUF7019 family protein [Streptomyces sp. NPDC058613]|uniref:DUF7019 family protein n=1 Tax=Streptomyces sp. NPDC058613 TaxID=3346556 RepID=UPI0036698A37